MTIALKQTQSQIKEKELSQFKMKKMTNYLQPSMTYQHQIIEKNLTRVFNEEFLAKHSEKDLGPIIDKVNKQDLFSLKQTNPIFHKFDAIYPLHQLVVCYSIID